ncbi:MAG: CPBP family intramembrane metalloprotease [Anaerolineales bacterium]|nr:CPBP family intramembrane metalloprotease [Anaerolineales bacterium]
MTEQSQVDWKRIAVFLVFAFGIAWLAGLLIYLRGGILDSRELVPDTGITEAFVLMATVYMFAPAISHVITRLVTREGWQALWLNLKFKQGWGYMLLAWFGTPLLIALGAVVYFVLFPHHFDANFETLNTLIEEMKALGQEVPFGPGTLALIQIFQAILIAPVLNLVPILGEEFGWRGYLLPRLLPMGERKAYLISGLIWGLWHAPVILMGYNYGTDYPAAPWSGTLLFILISFVTGTFFGWTSLRAGSIWPAVIGHAVLNGTASAAALFALPGTNPLIGPMMVGIIGSLGFSLITIWIFLRGIPSRLPETEE